jgi:NDP-sugar pyrophosphorylase family protein
MKLGPSGHSDVGPSASLWREIDRESGALELRVWSASSAPVHARESRARVHRAAGAPGGSFPDTMVCSARALPLARSPAELDALVLCGGLGTRLRAAVPDGPKALAPVDGRPFLEILLDALAARGVRRFVLCAGHGAAAIEAALPALRRCGHVVVSREEQPLGTGGALLRALPHAVRAPLLVVNGDSLCAVDLDAMLAAHRARGALLTLAAVPAGARSDVGAVRADADGRVIAFAERALPGVTATGATAGGTPLANAGVYLIEPRVLGGDACGGSAGEPRPLSLERELIPALLVQGVFAFELQGPLLDIGTPERLRAAPALLREMGMLRDAAPARERGAASDV